MELEELLRLEASRRNVDQIIEMINQHPEFSGLLWNIYLKNSGQESRRAAWVIDLLIEKGFNFNDHQIAEIIDFLPLLKNQGMKRHSLRILDNQSIPEEQIGQLVDICFKWLEAPESSVAVKMYSIKILMKVSEKEPLISRELSDIIELQLEGSTPGFRSIGLKTIMQLQKRISTLQFR